MRRVALGLATLVAVLSLAVAAFVVQGAGATPSANASSVSLMHSCGPAAAGFARCHAIVLVNAKSNGKPVRNTPTPTATSGGGGGGGGQNCSSNPTSGNTYPGYTACDLQSAYNLTTASGSNGSGATVALVDAYDDPNAASDIAVYRSQWGLPALNACGGAAPWFCKVSQTGSTSSLPKANGSWAQEESLDVDMASAICPKCNVLLVEASSNSNSNLATGVNYAAGRSDVVAISNSYGGSESSGETSYDADYNHPGKAITASSGDGGYGVEYPAASPYVTAVGGTSLVKASNTRGWSESVWNTSSTEGAGSGCSAYEAQPTWQAISNITAAPASCSKRAVADVSATADPYHGVDVYDSYSYQGSSGWLVFGGTSVASPIIASVYALAGNAATVNAGSYSYSHLSSLYDVTSGSTSSCGSDLCAAAVGWDGPTGNGTPNGTGAF